MDQLTRITIFRTVIEEQSFAAAAGKLGITGSAVSKQIQNLENDLQVKLIHRTTRSLSLTEEGAVYFERTSRALDDLAEAREAIIELKSKPRGPLNVSFPQSFGARYLSSCVAQFANMYPEVTLNVSLSDHLVDIENDGYDLVVRIASLQDGSLIARYLADCPIVVVASPEYLVQHGRPGKADDLTGHNVLAYTGTFGPNEWRFKSPQGQVGQVPLSGPMRSDSGDMLCSAAVNGVGIVMLPIFYVAEHLANGRLVRVLENYTTWPERNIHAVFQPNRHQSTRLRLFVDHLAAACKALPWA